MSVKILLSISIALPLLACNQKQKLEGHIDLKPSYYKFSSPAKIHQIKSQTKKTLRSRKILVFLYNDDIVLGVLQFTFRHNQKTLNVKYIELMKSFFNPSSDKISMFYTPAVLEQDKFQKFWFSDRSSQNRYINSEVKYKTEITSNLFTDSLQIILTNNFLNEMKLQISRKNGACFLKLDPKNQEHQLIYYLNHNTLKKYHPSDFNYKLGVKI